MKISSASKKVLASALSAAMVVAFAPTVAFGAPVAADMTVTIDLDGGTNARTVYTGVKQGDTIRLGSPNKGDYEIDHWFLDADGDGVQGSSEADIDLDIDTNSDSKFDSVDVTMPAAGDKVTAVTYKAVYAIPAATFGAFTDGTAVTHDGASLVVNTGSAQYKNGHTYVMTVAVNGSTVYTNTCAPVTANGAPMEEDGTTAAQATKTLTFKANPLSTDKAQIGLAKLASGEVTVTLTDNGATVSTKTLKLVEITLLDEAGEVENKAMAAANATTKKATFANIFGTSNYADADGYVHTGDAVLAADQTFTKTAAAQYTTAPVYNEVSRQLSFTISDSSAAKDDSFAVTVTDPSGSSIYSASFTIASTAALSKDIKIAFNAADADLPISPKAEAAGNYIVNVTKTTKAGVTTSSKAKTALTEVKFSAGEGTFTSPAPKADFFFDQVTDLTGTPATSTLKAPTGYENPTWKLNGKDYTTAGIVEGTVNEVVATYTAKHATVAAPVLTATESTVGGVKYYTVSGTSATAGAKVTYTTGDTVAGTADPDANAATFAPTPYSVAKASAPAVIKVIATSTTAVDTSIRGYDSEVVAYLLATGFSKDWAGLTSGATAVTTTAGCLESTVGNNTGKWLAVDGIAAAIASGKATFDAQGAAIYVTKKAKDDADLASTKALYEAVVAAADAELAKYEDGANVIAGNKVYTMTAAQLKGNLAAVKNAKVTAAEPTADQYKTGIIAVINAANSALTTTNSTTAGVTENKAVKAADLAAAQAVTAELKAATTSEAAEAALKAYAALSDDAKKLVATADVTAAEKIVAEAKAQAELVDAQDEGTLNKISGTKKLTFTAKKAKTTKARTITYTTKVSKSGNAVVYAKKSGSKQITVAKSGKVTLKKGAVKGKTYTAKVKATCGTQTRTVNVKFIVK